MVYVLQFLGSVEQVLKITMLMDAAKKINGKTPEISEEEIEKTE